ncbi:conserved membrane protein of unknown function [Georgfuchsia toluolica]|uniref:DUF1109 domain-containing protein n=1 Tax=Georgfuchsia toluolica TaxID=424218 RepID=A0A916J601_9PROT|nr:DUF1109 domain-containing protein [Georgfuchsia toluolica]CAG4884083.1 conserved membrane protein of unknown function [Georgfuchsia toluolica]
MRDFDQLVAELAGDATTVKPAPHPYLLSLKWIVVAAVYLALSLLLSGLRPDLAQALRQPWFSAEIVALLLIFIATSVDAALLAFPDLHQKRGLAFLPLWVFALFVLVLAFAWRADSPPAPPPEHTFQCTIGIVLLALLPAAWMFLVMRKVASTHGLWAGSIAALSAFSVGALWLRLHEANNSIVHVVEWHYLPMLACGLIGLWLGKLLLKW